MHRILREDGSRIYKFAVYKEFYEFSRILITVNIADESNVKTKLIDRDIKLKRLSCLKNVRMKDKRMKNYREVNKNISSLYYNRRFVKKISYMK